MPMLYICAHSIKIHMKLSKFKFELPEDLLAEYPAEHRDESRLMVLNRKEKTIEHHTFKDLINYFDEGDLFILNNTKKKLVCTAKKKKQERELKFFY